MAASSPATPEPGAMETAGLAHRSDSPSFAFDAGVVATGVVDAAVFRLDAGVADVDAQGAGSDTNATVDSDAGVVDREAEGVELAPILCDAADELPPVRDESDLTGFPDGVQLCRELSIADCAGHVLRGTVAADDECRCQAAKYPSCTRQFLPCPITLGEAARCTNAMLEPENQMLGWRNVPECAEMCPCGDYALGNEFCFGD